MGRVLPNFGIVDKGWQTGTYLVTRLLPFFLDPYHLCQFAQAWGLRVLTH